MINNLFSSIPVDSATLAAGNTAANAKVASPPDAFSTRPGNADNSLFKGKFQQLLDGQPGLAAESNVLSTEAQEALAALRQAFGGTGPGNALGDKLSAFIRQALHGAAEATGKELPTGGKMLPAAAVSAGEETWALEQETALLQQKAGAFVQSLSPEEQSGLAQALAMVNGGLSGDGLTGAGLPGLVLDDDNIAPAAAGAAGKPADNLLDVSEARSSGPAAQQASDGEAAAVQVLSAPGQAIVDLIRAARANDTAEINRPGLGGIVAAAAKGLSSPAPAGGSAASGQPGQPGPAPVFNSAAAGLDSSLVAGAALPAGKAPVSFQSGSLDRSLATSMPVPAQTLVMAKTLNSSSSAPGLEVALDKIAQLAGQGDSAVQRVQEANFHSTQPGGAARAMEQNASQLAANRPGESFGARLELPVSHSQWGSQLTQRVAWLSGLGIAAADIMLNPPELGPLHVRIDQQGEQATVVFSSNHANVREAIENSLPRLRELFADNGLELLDVDVADASEGETGQSDDTGDGDAALVSAGDDAQNNFPDSALAGEQPASEAVASEVITLRYGLVDAYA